MNINTVVITGRLTRDLELKYTPKGTAVVDLSIAINKTTKTDEKTVYVDVTAWGQQAETVAKYLGKGSLLGVTGELDLDQWEDKETGKKRSKLKVVAQNIQFGPKEGGGKQDEPPTRPQSQAQLAAAGGAGEDEDDTDLPF